MAQARSLRDISSSSRSNAAAVIGASTRIRGRVSGDGDLTVEGTVEGPISLRGDLTVQEGATATSDVEANNVTIAGSVEGEISASGHVRLVAGARVRGNLKGAGIAIEDGARFSGRIDIDFDLPAELSEPRAEARSTGGRR